MRNINGRDIYSIKEVNYFAKQTLEQMVFWIEGEISSFKKHPNWNFYYIDLKDENSLLPCIAQKDVFESPDDDLVGQKIIAYGNLSIYEPFGKYQFKIVKVEKSGEGLLQKQLSELISKLKKEGLFDEKYKKNIPEFPKRVCIVTSLESAAYTDFKTHSIEKFPIIELFTADIRVQGPSSVKSLLGVLPKTDKMNFDIIVITRGGGSIEDLAAFNDEQVARTIFKMKTPTVVAIGHEFNECLAEWVADVRASTPNDAANIITSGYSGVILKLNSYSQRLSSTSNYYFSKNLQKLDYIYYQLSQTKTKLKDLPHRLRFISETLTRHEKNIILDANSKVDDLYVQIQKNTKIFVENKSTLLKSLDKSLFILSPTNTLSRGYTITTNQQGKVLKSSKDVVVGSDIKVKFKDGNIISKVKSKQS